MANPMLGHKGTVRIATNAIGEITGYEVVIERDLHEDTACLDTTKTFQAGLRSWSGNFTAWFDYEGEALQADVLDELIDGSADGTVANAKFEFSEGDTTNGFLTGTIIIQRATITSQKENVIGLNIQFQGSGLPTWTNAVS